MMDEELQNNIKEIFDKFDSNHNGVLDKEEFCKGFSGLIKSLSEGQTDQEIQKIAEEAIEKFDLNKNGQIELDEFNQLMEFLINEKGLSIEDL
jgi:Ca2+-binding EF-hand superfamily protein